MISTTKPKILHVGLCVGSASMNAMQQAFVDNSSVYAELSTGQPNIDAEIEQLVMAEKFDFVFFQIQADRIVHSSTVECIKRTGAKVLNWTGDVRATVPAWMFSFGADITLFSNMRDVHEARAAGLKAEYLEIGFDEKIYYPDGPVIQTNDIVFFGNSYGVDMFPLSKYRIEMVSFLKSNYKRSFGVYGHGWNFSNGNFNHSQRDEGAGYRSAKIAINCSHFEIERYSSDRLLRILGTGTPICLAKWYPGIELDYEDGVHLRVWKDLHELNKLIRYYIAPENQKERAQIALNGMLLVQSKFTFDHMVKNAIKIYETL